MNCSTSKFPDAFATFQSNDASRRLTEYRVGFMVTMTGNDEHRKRKRMLSRPYSNSYILNSQTLGSVLSRVSRRLREEIAGWASTGVSVDVYQQAKCCTLDAASGWLFGSENTTDTLRDPGFENDLTTLASAGSKIIFVRTSLAWPIPYFASLIGNGLPDPDVRGRWEAWLTRVITDCYRRHPMKPSSTASLYDHFYDSFKAANPDMPRNEVASFIAVECDDHLSASHLGLGTLLAYTMYELSRHPDCQRALRKELLTLAEPSDQACPIALQIYRCLTPSLPRPCEPVHPVLAPFLVSCRTLAAGSRGSSMSLVAPS
jgi:unspecific monooxygenase